MSAISFDQVVEQPAPPLSALRQDIEIVSTGIERDGSPGWTLLDPISHRFIKINWRSFEMLSVWPESNASINAKALCNHPKLVEIDVSVDEIEALQRFLQINNLINMPATGGADYYYQQKMSTKQKWWQWLVHNYLFLKIPLFYPHNFLKKLYPAVNWMFSRYAAVGILCLAVVGLYFTAMQWDAFKSTFLYFFTPQGALGYILALVAIKLLHELGHAITLTHYGGRVPSIGVAFIVMFPVLYTDTSDAWRLSSHRQRIHIGAAGMLTELTIAVIGTFFWAILDDGILRSIAFFAATTGWISSLAVNLNPFMRFDGYYLLADTLQVENLQQRSFTHGKAELRYQLFGLPKEGLLTSLLPLHWRLVFYAWCTWVYRFFLFLGIAFLVYTFFFKVLGVVVFIIEIVWFILLPIAKELEVWWSMRDQIKVSSRAKKTGLLAAMIVLAGFLPLSSSVYLQGLVSVDGVRKVFSPAPARLIAKRLEEGALVKSGDVLLNLDSPELTASLAIKTAEREVIVAKLKASQFDDDKRSDVATLRSEKNQLDVDIQGIQKLLAQLEISVDRDAIVRDIHPDLTVGRWVSENQLLFTHLPAAEHTRYRVRAYVREQHINRLALDQHATFYPEAVEMSPVKLTLVGIAKAGAQVVDVKALASTYGGEIPTKPNEKEGLQAELAVHELIFEPTDSTQKLPLQVLRGAVTIEADRRSFFAMTFRRAASIVRRELGI